MRIGIDCSSWDNQRGFGRFTRGLVPALLAHAGAHQYTCFFAGTPPAEVQATGHAMVQVGPATAARGARAHGGRPLADIAAFARAAAAHATDMFLFPAVYSWFPLVPGRRSVLGVHDAIAEQFPHLVFPQRSARALWSLKLRLALWQATRVLTVSASARDDIVRYLHVDPRRIDVATEGVEAWFHREPDAQVVAAACAALGLPVAARYLLYVGGLAPHKNLPGLLQGFAQAIADHRLADLRLVIVGDPQGGGFHSSAAEVQRQIRDDPRLGTRVILAGFLADERLPALYTGALAAVMPAFSEGFGLPALEALACGTPVLSHAGGAVPEVVGDAGVRFDTRDPATIAAAIVAIATDATLVARLRAATANRAAQFSWARAAALTLASLAHACEAG